MGGLFASHEKAYDGAVFHLLELYDTTVRYILIYDGGGHKT